MATKGIVKGIVSNLVTVEVDGPVSQRDLLHFRRRREADGGSY